VMIKNGHELQLRNIGPDAQDEAEEAEGHGRSTRNGRASTKGCAGLETLEQADVAR